MQDLGQQVAGLLLADVAARAALPEVVVGERIDIEVGPQRKVKISLMRGQAHTLNGS